MFLLGNSSLCLPTLNISNNYSCDFVQVLVLCRVSESSLNTSLNQEDINEILPVSSQPLSSNIYSAWELRLLTWLNMHFQHTRKTAWGTVRTHYYLKCFFSAHLMHSNLLLNPIFSFISERQCVPWIADVVPSARWIVNFDLDLADGLVLASLLASYCPYLVSVWACVC